MGKIRINKLTPAEMAAGRLRQIARDLILEAEALEAATSIQKPKEYQQAVDIQDPRDITRRPHSKWESYR